MNKVFFLCALTSLISVAFAETCQKPEIVASSYVTEDATVLTNVAFTMQFVLKCNNGVKGISLYAEVEGKTLPAVRLSADNKYQISWTEDIKKARSGDYYIKLYDEEKYVAVRKAIIIYIYIYIYIYNIRKRITNHPELLNAPIMSFTIGPRNYI
ncbi:Translocon-associated protein subunit delta [Cyphomyrmex costatus]|uniref:Translocon-associated protein subunit delta n=1 Tax=Cyphomyrmex costatus TaxID=456900 RepID=A0A195CV87_9HYME|nr:Translocon-associated protein subunit delta [Cyphomyrmex costatus]